MEGLITTSLVVFFLSCYPSYAPNNLPLSVQNDLNYFGGYLLTDSFQRHEMTREQAVITMFLLGLFKESLDSKFQVNDIAVQLSASMAATKLKYTIRF